MANALTATSNKMSLKISDEEKRWRAEEIKSDKSRMKAVQDHAAKQANAMAKVAKAPAAKAKPMMAAKRK